MLWHKKNKNQAVAVPTPLPPPATTQTPALDLCALDIHALVAIVAQYAPTNLSPECRISTADGELECSWPALIQRCRDYLMAAMGPGFDTGAGSYTGALNYIPHQLTPSVTNPKDDADVGF